MRARAGRLLSSRTARAALASLWLPAALLAQGSELRSGPEVGAALAPVPVYAPDGPRAGTEFDAAAAIGQGPGALLFVHEITRNVAPVLRGLDELAAEFALLGFRSFTIRLDDDRTAAEQRVQAVSRALGLRNPMVVSTEGAEGPGDYALNRKCSLTLVLVDAGAVRRSVAFTDTGRQDLPRLRQWVEGVAGELPENEAGLRALIEKRLADDPAALKQRLVELTLEVRRLRRELDQSRDGGSRRMRAERAEDGDGAGRDGAGARPARRREGKAPDDEALRGLLRDLLRQDNDAAELDEVFAAIDARVGTDAGLRHQAADMLRLMLSSGDGNDDARRRAREWIDARREPRRM